MIKPPSTRSLFQCKTVKSRFLGLPPGLLAFVYIVLLFSGQGEFFNLFKTLLVKSGHEFAVFLAIPAISSTAIETTSIVMKDGADHPKQCIHHRLVCPPDCHCPQLETTTSHMDEVLDESNSFGSEGHVWRPCQSEPNGHVTAEIPVHLLAASNCLFPSQGFRGFIWPSSENGLNADSKPIEKVPIVS